MFCCQYWFVGSERGLNVELIVTSVVCTCNQLSIHSFRLPTSFPAVIAALSLSEGVGNSYWMLCATPVRPRALSSKVIKMSSYSLSSPAIHLPFGLLVCLLSAPKGFMVFQSVVVFHKLKNT